MAAILLAAQTAPAQALFTDDFNGLLAWKPMPSDGVSMQIVHDPRGREGGSMRLDVDFQGHAGYAIAHRAVSLDLPSDYVFSFWIKGDVPPNNLEFKLIDASGENVWWVDQRNYRYPPQWTDVALKKRRFEFAWGPAGGGEPKHIAAIEIVVTAGTGGKGSVWIDDLTLAARHVVEVERPVVFSEPEHDFPEVREFGGLTVESNADEYDVETASGSEWRTAYRVRGALPGKQFLFMPETEARRVRITPPPIRATIEPIGWSETPNAFFTNVALESPRGNYPRYFHGEQSYWTVVGVDGDTDEALVNRDGAIEPFKGGFSIEPFVSTAGRLVTWNDVDAKPSLARGDLPIPSVEWPQMKVTATAIGTAGKSAVRLDYTLRTKTPATLFLAIRPFQVDPPWQFLAVTGGAASIPEVRCVEDGIEAGGHRILASAARCGATTFDRGNLVERLRRGAFPQSKTAADPHGWTSGVLAFELRPNETATVTVPFHQPFGTRPPDWAGKLDRVIIRVPPSAQRIVDSIRANLAWILIHRDGAALQPGSRSYDRSWIRDGSMIADALLRLGLPEVVRDYIHWYARFQYPDGKVPCCVDSRGADPVPENDSHGELIWLIANDYRYTRDRALAEAVWPHVVAAVGYIDQLRKTQTAPQFFGLLPASISHEGYSAHPEHSFWDDFFTAKGLADAAWLAGQLGHAEEAKRFAAIHDEFERDLLAAIARAMAAHHIDYIPGSVELGDFDPTSTTIAIEPGGQLGSLPRAAVAATFDRYFAEAHARTIGAKAWENYTPYELRSVGTFVRLGEPERAHELLDFFFRGQRPPQWREWAEVVWHDPKTPKFVGDMPHGWVGSDYLRSVLDMFAYDRDDGVLVIGAGIPRDWLATPGVEVRGLHTHEGILNFTMRGDRVTISGRLDASRGIVVRSPLGRKEITIHHVPAEIRFKE